MDDERRKTDDGHWLITTAHNEHFELRWAKNMPVLRECDTTEQFMFKMIKWNDYTIITFVTHDIQFFEI